MWRAQAAALAESWAEGHHQATASFHVAGRRDGAGRENTGRCQEEQIDYIPRGFLCHAIELVLYPQQNWPQLRHFVI